MHYASVSQPEIRAPLVITPFITWYVRMYEEEREKNAKLPIKKTWCIFNGLLFVKYLAIK